MRRHPSLFVVSCIALCFSYVSASARLFESWPYKRLFKESDLIVVATATSTEKSADTFKDKRWPLDFVGMNTAFEVKHVLSGKDPGKKIRVLHYKFGEVPKELKDVQLVIENEPLFVGFRTKPFPVKETMTEVPRPEYMLFLRSLKDGRFEPVSGKIDPQLSVRELFEPLYEDLGGSRRHE